MARMRVFAAFSRMVGLVGLLRVIFFCTYCVRVHSDIVLEGELKSTTTFRGAQETRARLEFKAELSGCGSRIQSTPKNQDSTGVIEYRSFKGGSFIRSAIENPQSRNAAIVRVFPGVIPGENSALLGVLWLAYGSGCYLQTNRAGLSEPIIYKISAAHKDDLRLKAKWSFSDKSKVFPDVYEDYLTETLFTENADKLQSIPIKGGPFTNTSYSVLNWTNVHGENVPWRFKFIRYIWDEQTSSPKMSQEVIGETLNARVVDSIPAVTPDLDIPPKSLVIDYRTKVIGTTLPVHYFSTNGEIKSRLSD